MIKGEYVFLDTETTGCRPTIDRVTEVGLYHIVDGEIQLTWNSLINPACPIPLGIQQLTGITDEMVEAAPYFAEIAPELADILQDKILVAHNARFDHAFIKNELKRAGISLRVKTLCTVKLSRLLLPQLTSHKLDNIKAHFNLPGTTRHRALADAELLILFFKELSKKFPSELLQQAIDNLVKRSCLPTHIANHHVDEIPDNAGVYRFYGDNGNLLYIGKSVSLRDRILSHFSGDHSSNKELQLTQQMKSLDWISTAGELGALLLESKLIKQELPIFNRALRRHKQLYTIQRYQDENNYCRLKIARLSELVTQDLNSIYGFYRSKKQAEEKLHDITKAHNLCLKLNHLEKSKSCCFYHQIKRCNGACIGIENPDVYNLRLETAIIKMHYKKWPYQGKIAIKEHCTKSLRTEYHIIDQWCYLGSAKTPDELYEFSALQAKPALDMDIYKILTNFLLKKRKTIEIIKLYGHA